MIANGHGRVVVERAGSRSRIVALSARSPLQILAPRSLGAAAWIFTSSHGGGLVDGDAVRLDVTVGEGAAALLTTQASTKIYPGASEQELSVVLGAGALLVALPDPVVGFAGARYRQRATLRLAASASLCWLESLTSGRAARGERWRFDGYCAHTAIDRDGVALVRDGLILDAAHGALAPRFGRFDALATVFVVGPACRALRAHLLDAASKAPPVVIAPSPLGDAGDAAVVRLAAHGPEALVQALARLLAPVADLLGEDPFARKLVGDNALR